MWNKTKVELRIQSLSSICIYCQLYWGKMKIKRGLVLWLWDETHVQKVVGWNPSTIYWMNIFLIYLF